ncbi:MAG: cyclically-permuted mutarotase family protein [Bacteroidaceae bacterium]|nr:cyclically-permuted mutarotase family protein [Bacteroidaceae bacterium]
MKRILSILISASLLGCTGGSKGEAPALKEIGTMPAFESGFEQGVSACYAATHDDCLYIAGGCNFPETPAAEGGAKRYYKGIYRASLGDTLQWQKVGHLPVASGYGANIQAGSRWIIVGGMNGEGASAEAISIDLADACKIEKLPPLPCTVDNTAGAAACGKLYIVGGNADGKPSKRVFVLDLEKSAEGWHELPPMPSRPRVQPVCAASNSALYVWGGFCPADSAGGAATHTDGLCYSYATGRWSPLPDVTIEGEAITLSGGTMTLRDNSTIIAAGGVNRDIFTDAISGTYALIDKADYMLQPSEWYRFNPRLMRFDTESGLWSLIDKNSAYARAGALILAHKSDIIYIGGELKPGIRTPQIHRHRK